MPSVCACLPSQRCFAAAVKLYDQGDFAAAIAAFEEALLEYFRADVECRALCQWPQKFEGYDYLRYRYSLYEVVSGKTGEVLYVQTSFFNQSGLEVEVCVHTSPKARLLNLT